jgi:hypothetical protein
MDMEPSPMLPPQYHHWAEDLASAAGGINWQERCLELQLELHRFRHQAGRVRDMLREKVGPRPLYYVAHMALYCCFRLLILPMWIYFLFKFVLTINTTEGTLR